MPFSGTVAIAALSTRVLGPEYHQRPGPHDRRRGLPYSRDLWPRDLQANRHALRHLLAKSQPRGSLRTAAVAALRVTGKADALRFSLHAHAPLPGRAGAAALTAWLGALVADDPLLIGYRLARTSRLLRASGYPRDLAGSFGLAGRAEILDVLNGQPLPLSVIAVRSGIMAVDEEALLRACPLNRHTAATLALVNAVASWSAWVRQLPAAQASDAMRRDALRQLGHSLQAGPTPAVVIAAAFGSIH